MNTQDDGRVRCPRCGAEYEPQKLGGVCPACAFGEALSAPAAGGGARKLCLEDIPLPAGQGAAANLAKTILVPGLVEEQTGARIGHYKLLQQIGEGGCGVVYLAEQEEPIRRRVALKVIKLGMDTKQVIARFEAERQALALMGHPNIAMVLDGGAADTGRPYFVMELVRGIRITPDGTMIFFSDGTGTGEFWSLSQWVKTAEFQLDRTEIRCAAFSADGKWLAVGTQNQGWGVIESATGLAVYGALLRR